MTYTLVGVTNPAVEALSSTEIAADFPASFPTIVLSAWVEFSEGGAGFRQDGAGGVETKGALGWTMDIDPPGSSEAAINVNVGNGQVYEGIFLYFGGAAFDASTLTSGVYHHIYVSIDAPGNTIACYIDGNPAVSLGSTWLDDTEIVWAGSSTPSSITVGGSEDILVPPCYADVYWGLTPVPVTAFINPDGTPVDLGSNGQNPTGSPPIVYLSISHGGGPNDFLTNLGSAGGLFDGDPAICPGTPTPTPTPTPSPSFVTGLGPPGPPGPAQPAPVVTGVVYGGLIDTVNWTRPWTE